MTDRGVERFLSLLYRVPIYSGWSFERFQLDVRVALVRLRYSLAASILAAKKQKESATQVNLLASGLSVVDSVSDCWSSGSSYVRPHHISFCVSTGDAFAQSFLATLDGNVSCLCPALRVLMRALQIPL